MRQFCTLMLVLGLLAIGATAPIARADIAGFGDGTGFTLNGNIATVAAPSIDDGVATITTMVGGLATSVYYDTPQDVSSFVTHFDFQIVNPNTNPADGLGFVIQNDPNQMNALGAAGSAVGYGGVDRSAAIMLAFYQWSFSEAGINGVLGRYIGGDAAQVSTLPVNLSSGNPIRVTLSYDGANATLDLVDLTTADTVQRTFPVHIPALAGGNTAYVGFSGGTGGAIAEQTISNFAFFAGTTAESLDWNAAGSGNWGDSQWEDGGAAVAHFPTFRSSVTVATDTVTVEGNHAAMNLDVGSGAVQIANGMSLAVTNGLNVAAGASIGIGNNASLSAGYGSISQLNIDGNASLAIAGPMTVTNLGDGGAAGVFSKSGGGTLSIDSNLGTIDLNNSAVRVEAGTLALSGVNPLGGSTQPVQLAGGTFQISGPIPPVPALPGVAGLQLHLDGSDVTGTGSSPADGSTVATWADLSGNGLNATAAGTPTFQSEGLRGMGAVHFDGSDGFTLGNLSGTFPTAATLFVMTELDNDAGYNLFTTRNNDTWWRYHGNGLAYPGPFRTARIDNYTTMPTDGVHVFEVVSSATTWEMLQDGVSKGAVGGLYNPGDDYRIGMPDNADANKYLAGDIGEVLVYDRELLPAERDTVRNYLLQKYAAPEAISMTGTDFVVSENSTIHADTGLTADFGVLTLESGVVTTSGASGGMSFTRTDIAASATAVGLDPRTDTDFGPLAGLGAAGGPNVTITKAGPSTMTLTAAPTNLSNATWDAGAGTLAMVGSTPWGGATKMKLSGGTFVVTDNPSSTPVVPSMVGGLALHLDAGDVDGDGTPDVFGDGTAVETWVDKSGNGNDAVQLTVAAQPVQINAALGGEPVVRFNTSQFINTATHFGNPYTIMTVSQMTGGVNLRLISSADVNWLMGYHGGLEDVMHANPWVGHPGPTATTDAHIYGAVGTGSQTRFYGDGVDLTTSSAPTSPLGRLQLNGWSNGTAEASDGDVAEVIVFNRALSDIELDQIGFYLEDKYGFDTSYSIGQIPALDYSTHSVEVTADSTLNAATNTTATFGDLTLRGGTLVTTGATDGISFASTTVDVDPASGLEAGLDPQGATDYGAGPLELKSGVIKSAGVTFNGVNIPNTATAVGFNPGPGTIYGTIEGNATSAVVSKTGSGAMLLNPGDVVNLHSNATLNAQGGTLTLGGSAAFAGASNARLSGGTMKIYAGSYEPAGLEAGLTGAWLFDEGAGSVAGDSTYNGAGAIVGAAWVDDPTRGMVLDFEGADEVRVGSGPFGTVNEAVTVAFWQYGDEAIQPQSDTIFQAKIGGARAIGSHLPWSNSNVYWDAGGALSCCNDRINFAIPPEDFKGQWNHYAYTKDTTTGEMKVFINGVERGSRVGAVIPLGGIDRMTIGSEGDLVNSYDGMIDEFLLYDRALSAGEVDDLFNNGIALTELPAISMTDKHFTVTADSTLTAASDSTAAFGGLTLEGGTVAITGAPDGVSFNSLTVNAPGATGGVNLQTSATFGAGAVSLQAGVLKTEGQAVTFNGVDIPVTADAVGLNPIAQTTYGQINGNLMSGTVAKTGPGTLSLATGDTTAMTNATWVAEGGTLKMVGEAAWGGSTNATLAGGMLQILPQAVVPTDVTTGQIQLAHFEFEDADDLGLDSEMTGRTRTNIGSPAHAPDGIVGGALLLDGASRINVASDGMPAESFTISTWLYMDEGSTGWRTAFGDWETGNLWAHLGKDSGETFGDHGGGHTFASDPSGNLQRGKWYHVVSVRGADGENQLWLDGVKGTTSAGLAQAPTGTMYIGSKDPAGGNPWIGMIDDLRIYDGAITPEDIGDLYGNGLGPHETLPAIAMTDKNFTVTADSTLFAATDSSAAFGSLTLQNGIATVTGAPDGVSFTSITVPAGAIVTGINSQATVSGPLTLNAGVLRTSGQPIAFDSTAIPASATSVALDPRTATDYGVITGGGAGPAVTISKFGPDTLSLTETNVNLANATWDAHEGALTMQGTGPLGGSTELQLSGGTFKISGTLSDVDNGPAGAQAYYSFDDSGNPGSDDTLGGSDGTLMNGAAWTATSVLGAGALALDGVNDFVSVTIDLSETDYAAAMWFKADTDNRGLYSAVLDDLSGTSDRHIYLTGGAMAARTFNNEVVASPGLALADGLWHHVVHTYGSEPGGQKLYIDGVLAAEGLKDFSDFNWGDQLNIGFSADGAIDFFDGLVDEVYIYDRELTAAEVSAMAGERAAVDVSGVNVSVTGDSTLIAAGGSGATFASLTMKYGVLATSGVPVTFPTTTIDPNAAIVGFNPMTETNLGPLDGSNAAATIRKTGSGDLILSAAGSNLGNATFSAEGGRLIVLPDGASSVGDATLQPAGGELVLSAKAGSMSPVLYDNAVAATGGTLTAGMGGQAGAAAGPMTVQVGSAGVNDVTVAAGSSLRLRSTDDYTLEIIGNVTGDGQIVVDDASSMIVLAGPATSIGSLSVANGTTSLTGANATIGNMTSSGGTTTLAAATNVDNMTVIGGTVNTTGSDVGVGTRLTLASHGYQVAGGSMAVRGADLLSGAVVSVDGGTLSISGPAVLPIKNPLAYYSFDNAGNVTNDDSGNGNTGTLIAPAAANVDGKYGGSLFLNTGAIRQGQMRIEPGGINLDQDVTDEWTVAGWYLNLAPIGDWRTFMRGFTADHHIIVETSSDNLGAYVAGFRPANTTLTADAGVWHHITAVGDAGGTTIYLDGAQIGDKIGFRAFDNVYVVGGYQNNTQRFAEKLDEVLIYGRALSPEDVAKLMDPPAETVDQESTSLAITGNATITTGATEAVLGNLSVAAGVTAVNLQNAAYSFNNATIADGVTVNGEWAVGGSLSVGNSVGTMTLGNGELAFGSGATYDAEVNLGDGVAAIEADTIVISNEVGVAVGSIELNGTLAPKGIGRTDSDFFSVSTTVTVIDNSAKGVLTGVAGDTDYEFATVDPAPANDVSAHIGQGAFLRDVIYEQADGFITNSVDLEVFVALGGDTDGDKKVWLSDWAALRANFGNTANDKTWIDGNFDPWVDGKVWLSDWAALRANFGNVDYTTAEAAAVPEPGTIAMLLGALAGLAVLGWRRRRTV